MNSVSLIGRLTRDPQIRYNGDSDESAVATFNIAIDRPTKKDGTKATDFPRITVFGKQAVNCERYLAKGRLVGISGRIQTGSYTNKNGETVYTTDVVANRVDFLGFENSSQRDDVAPTQAHQNVGYNQQRQERNDNNAWEAVDDDDIPF